MGFLGRVCCLILMLMVLLVVLVFVGKSCNFKRVEYMVIFFFFGMKFCFGDVKIKYFNVDVLVEYFVIVDFNVEFVWENGELVL